MLKDLSSVIQVVMVSSSIAALSCSSDDGMPAGNAGDAGALGVEAGCPAPSTGCPVADAGCPATEAAASDVDGGD
jgi:hypothetical protein